MQGVFGEVVLWIYVQLATIMQENALYYGEEMFMKFKNKIIESIFLIFPLLLALICLASVSFGTHQASLPIPMPQELILTESLFRCLFLKALTAKEPLPAFLPKKTLTLSIPKTLGK